jgi:hypothetical protein
MTIKSYLGFTTLSLALLLELAMSGVVPTTATSYSITEPRSPNSSEELIAQRRSRLRFKVPNVRSSRNLEGGAARGNCSLDGTKKIQMKALLPNTNIGLTTVGKPTVFFQISSTSAQQAKFLLLNDRGDSIIYEKTFPLTKTGGVMSFTLPADANALEVGKEYTWELAVLCDPDDQKGNPSIQGSIKRMPPNQKLASDLARIPLRDRVALYADEGYWYDSLKILADLLSANPKDSTLTTDWKDLLESAGLNTVALDPLLPCCTPKN